MLIRYRDDINLSDAHMQVVDQANEIITEYEAQEISLTLRALYYRFVARFPEVLDPKSLAKGLTVNTIQNYKRLGSILNRARLAGEVSWLALEDLTRNLVARSVWNSPREVLEAAHQSYAIPLWGDQEDVAEAWIEKDAAVGTIAKVCRDNDVAYLSCRGNTSQTEMWLAGKRIRERWENEGKNTVIFHIGDHDPNGVDMTRDNRDRLSMFCGFDVDLRRIAINMDQIELYAPPPNPVKNTDSRATSYRAMMRQHGYDEDECWELDALDPVVIRDLLQEGFESIRDEDLWDAAVARQEEHRGLLRQMIDSVDPTL